MPLHPEAQALLDVAEQLGQTPIYELSPEEARAQVVANTALLPPGPEVAHVEDIAIPVRDGAIGARRYEPADAGDTVIVWLHGGGWVICNLDTHDATCRLLANAAQATVVSVAYRLAPEHRFPGPLDDCFDAVSWIAAQHPDRRHRRSAATAPAATSPRPAPCGPATRALPRSPIRCWSIRPSTSARAGPPTTSTATRRRASSSSAR